MTAAATHPDIIFTRSLRVPGERDAVYRAHRRKHLVRLGHGAYLRTDEWSALSVEGKHVARMRALSDVRPVVFSHRSAALAWGLPLFGSPAPRPEVLVPIERGDRSDRASILHRTSIPFIREIADGLPVTTIDRTLIDVARRCQLTVSVPMLDNALAHGRTTVERLQSELENGTHIGRRRCANALSLADPLAQTPGESISRVLLDSFGMPRPLLQVTFRDSQGRIGDTDFWWPGLNLIGEFDGFGKYVREEFCAGGRERKTNWQAQNRRGPGRAGPGRGGSAGQACRAAFSVTLWPRRGTASTAPVREFRRKSSPGTPDSSIALTVRGACASRVTLVPAVT